ncbi:hypothetical protein ANCCEY_15218 [Ancylostoma ceylanicum]|uniref:Thiamine pyrophosphate enzyme N-terminal TPP-binding domain-containing protein n=1 Tax=Ancylostoma ceylanicum TaxID=53326 RepID=A0A0D6L484_9BILA|nr:hypothetical protein ANCCEY_15218 [Ancylostoma ceylanicum]
MGMAQETGKPVGIICTSGSAMLNYYPAVAEAYYQRIPLVVISADRPEKWINQGDGQTIVQRGVYANHIEAETQLNEEMSELHVRNEVIRAFEAVSCYSKGPIHFNVALEEPLYNTVEIPEHLPQKIEWQPERHQLNEHETGILKEGLKLNKKMILIGQMPKNPYFQELTKESGR